MGVIQGEKWTFYFDETLMSPLLERDDRVPFYGIASEGLWSDEPTIVQSERSPVNGDQ